MQVAVVRADVFVCQCLNARQCITKWPKHVTTVIDQCTVVALNTSRIFAVRKVHWNVAVFVEKLWSPANFIEVLEHFHLWLESDSKVSIPDSFTKIVCGNQDESHRFQIFEYFFLHEVESSRYKSIFGDKRKSIFALERLEVKLSFSPRSSQCFALIIRSLFETIQNS